MAFEDWHKVSLLGIDVGFSKRRPTTGIAVLEKGELTTCHVGSDASARLEVIGSKVFDSIAIDGPLIPVEADQRCRRVAESLLVGGDFEKRCKPGMSHSGQGLQLREAAHQTLIHLTDRAKATPELHKMPVLYPSGLIVEAFPNAFLGVMLDDRTYSQQPTLKRGKKFDWLYERAVENGLIGALMDYLTLSRWVDASRFELEQHHERRAALICVLTAACALADEAECIGDVAGGWICLPPKALWTDWARDALQARQLKMLSS